MQKFTLAQTPTTFQLEIYRDVASSRRALLTQQTQFVLEHSEVEVIIWFLQAVKADKSIRHTHTDINYILEYDPSNEDLSKFVLKRRQIGRSITMDLSTAYKLLDALTGNTERLVKDEGEQ
jgi:hypothetical protein